MNTEKELAVLVVKSKGNSLLSLGLTLDGIYKVDKCATNGFLVKNGLQSQAIGIISLALGELTTLVESNLTNTTIITTAILIVDKYSHHRPQEAVIALQNGLVGKYGKTYGKTTTAEIMRWLAEYDEIDRAEFFEKRCQSNTLGWQEINPKIFKQYKETQTKTMQPEKEKTPQQKKNELHQKLMREFDKGSFETNGGRFIQYLEHTLSIDEYVQVRLNELLEN